MNIKEIEFIERKLKIVIPQFYINFMLNYPHNQYEELDSNILSYETTELIDLNKEAYRDLWGKPLSKEYFVIGENGCGDSYIIGLSSEQTIIMFNHEDQCFYTLANSFEDYVARVINDTTEENLENTQFLVNDLRSGNLNNYLNSNSTDKQDESHFKKFRNWFIDNWFD